MILSPLDMWILRRLSAAHGRGLLDLPQYQLERLRETLDYTRTHSRFYRERLRGLKSEDIGSLEDVGCIPFTYPEMLAGAYSDFLCVSPRRVQRIVTLSTSGTMGAPKRIAFTDDDLELTADFFDYGMRTLVHPGDHVTVFMPGPAEGSVGDLLNRALRRFNGSATVFGPIFDYAKALDALRREKSDCAVGIPCQLLALARYTRGNATGVRLKNVLLSADYAAATVRNSIEEAWGCRVFDHYGMTEMGFGGAMECDGRNGYHMREADLLFEIIDPDTGQRVKDGEYGEVVFSTLTRRGMPLLRYRTGDFSRILPGPCACGSTLKRLERIRERRGASVRLADGRTLSITQLDEALLSESAISAYTAAIDTRDGFDCLSLTVQPTGGPINFPELSHRIERIASVGTLLCQKRLRLDIRTGPVDYATTGAAKRRIMDHRSSQT